MLNFDFVSGVGLETLAMLLVASLAMAQWFSDEPAAAAEDDRTRPRQ